MQTTVVQRLGFVLREGLALLVVHPIGQIRTSIISSMYLITETPNLRSRSCLLQSCYWQPKNKDA